MADISRLTLPSGTTYDIKDSTARADIEDIKSLITGAMHYKGITSTVLYDGDTTSTLIIDGKSVTFTAADAGSVVIYEEREYVWNGTKWQEFGTAGSLKALAFKDTASAEYTPTGSIDASDFTGTTATINGSGTFTPQGSVSLSKSDKEVPITPGKGVVTYTPSGDVDVTVTPSTTTITPIDSTGSLPSCTLPSLTTTVENETLTLSWAAGSFDAGTLPTVGAGATVVTGIASASGSFTGDGVHLTGSVSTADSASFTGSEGNVSTSASYTPEGINSTPSFHGTPTTITVS